MATATRWWSPTSAQRTSTGTRVGTPSYMRIGPRIYLIRWVSHYYRKREIINLYLGSAEYSGCFFPRDPVPEHYIWTKRRDRKAKRKDHKWTCRISLTLQQNSFFFVSRERHPAWPPSSRWRNWRYYGMQWLPISESKWSFGMINIPSLSLLLTYLFKASPDGDRQSHPGPVHGVWEAEHNCHRMGNRKSKK